MSKANKSVAPQSLGRFYRAGEDGFEPVKEVLTIYLDEASTIDETVFSTLQAKGELAIRLQVKANMEQEIGKARLRTKGAKPARR